MEIFYDAIRLQPYDGGGRTCILLKAINTTRGIPEWNDCGREAELVKYRKKIKRVSVHCYDESSAR